MALTRRDFNSLTVAAFSGAMAGAAIGCGGDEAADNAGAAGGDGSPGDAKGGPSSGGNAPASDETKFVGGELPEHNACLGLNQCKEYGRNPGEHDCVGQGACATVTSAGPQKNACKYLGACNGTAGANECKGQGGCTVPLEPFGDELWQQARAAFEERMKAKRIKVGKAPLP